MHAHRLPGSSPEDVAKTLSLGPPPNGVSCEFANADASSIVIANIGSGGIDVLTAQGVVFSAAVASVVRSR